MRLAGAQQTDCRSIAWIMDAARATYRETIRKSDAQTASKPLHFLRNVDNVRDTFVPLINVFQWSIVGAKGESKSNWMTMRWSCGPVHLKACCRCQQMWQSTTLCIEEEYDHGPESQAAIVRIVEMWPRLRTGVTRRLCFLIAYHHCALSIWTLISSIVLWMKFMGTTYVCYHLAYNVENWYDFDTESECHK